MPFGWLIYSVGNTQTPQISLRVHNIGNVWEGKKLLSRACVVSCPSLTHHTGSAIKPLCVQGRASTMDDKLSMACSSHSSVCYPLCVERRSSSSDRGNIQHQGRCRAGKKGWRKRSLRSIELGGCTFVLQSYLVTSDFTAN